MLSDRAMRAATHLTLQYGRNLSQTVEQLLIEKYENAYEAESLNNGIIK